MIKNVKGSDHLIEGMGLDLWEFVFHVVWIHCPNLVTGWSPENFDNLNQLVDSGFARKEGLTQH